MKKKIVMSYSGGKDSTLALHRLLNSEEYEVVALFTSVTEGFDRTSVHGVRKSLAEEQAAAIGLPVIKMTIPQSCDNETYNKLLVEQMEELFAEGIEFIGYGDIHLQDVKEYRDNLLQKTNIKPIYPLWGEETGDLMKEFFDLGYKTVVTCIDTSKLDVSFLGRVMDEGFVQDLPENVDPCGENGEFHTFVYEGPALKKSVEYALGEYHQSKLGSFMYIDLVN